ncbi:hypothetical protein COP2_013998 [Malus domestica]
MANSQLRPDRENHLALQNHCQHSSPRVLHQAKLREGGCYGTRSQGQGRESDEVVDVAIDGVVVVVAVELLIINQQCRRVLGGQLVSMSNLFVLLWLPSLL